MKIEEITQLVTNKKNALQDARNLAYMSGDMETYFRIENEIAEVQIILDRLNLTN